MRTDSRRHWGDCKYNILHSLRDLKQAKAEWTIKAFRDAIERLPRSGFNDERRALISRMQMRLEMADSAAHDFAMVSSRCT